MPTPSLNPERLVKHCYAGYNPILDTNGVRISGKSVANFVLGDTLNYNLLAPGP